MILSYIRTIILYLILICVVRIMGKRQIGEMEPPEFVVTMLVANLAAIPMQDGAIPLYSGLVPILTVLGSELVLSGLILRSIAVRRFFCGKPVILINNGKILMENLRATRVTLDELSGHLREKDVLDISQVQYAILETDGNLSVFPYPRFQPAQAREVGITDYKAELLPQDKVAAVESLIAENGGKGLAFVGDGINDAPVLSRADVGIAMGALGSDAAIEAADVVLMDDDPRKIAQAIAISRKCLTIVYQNIVFAIGVKAVCLLLGALGLAGMWAAIFADVGVMVLAVLNAMRAMYVPKN